MNDFQDDYYAILAVQESATAEEVHKAYLKLAKKLHPDRFPNDEEGKAIAQAEFRQVTQAHYILGDPERRAEYDRLRQLSQSRLLAPGEEVLDDASADNVNQKWAEKHLARADDLYQRCKYQEAETAIKEAIRLLPQEVRYHNKLAEIYLARNWRTYAMTEIQTSLRLDPADAQARNLEARIKELSWGQSAFKGLLNQVKQIFSKKA